MGKKLDLVGQRFGRLVVIEEAGRNKSGEVLWRCRCQRPCGKEIVVSGCRLRSENTTSCGCYSRERTIERNTTHGMTKTRLYRIWCNVLVRTGIHKGAKEKDKRLYQERGITVCEEWLVFENFHDWALSHGYRDDLQLDRIDNEKGYCPENCRWVTCKENINNRRNTVRLEDGTPLALFCSKVGIQTVGEDGNPSKQYRRIRQMHSRSHKAHPELIHKANEYLTLLRRLKASLDLLADIWEFRHEHKIQDPQGVTN